MVNEKPTAAPRGPATAEAITMEPIKIAPPTTPVEPVQRYWVGTMRNSPYFNVNVGKFHFPYKTEEVSTSLQGVTTRIPWRGDIIERTKSELDDCLRRIATKFIEPIGPPQQFDPQGRPSAALPNIDEDGNERQRGVTRSMLPRKNRAALKPVGNFHIPLAKFVFIARIPDGASVPDRRMSVPDPEPLMK